MQTVSRAVREDLEHPIQYEVSFMRNDRGHVITDRRFNTASLMAIYLGKDAVASDSMNWNPNDPNTLSMNLPGVLDVAICTCKCVDAARDSLMQGPCILKTLRS